LIPQPADTALELAGLVSGRGVKVVTAAAGMGVQYAKGFVLAAQGADKLHQHGVLEDIGEVAGVEAMAVAEHGFSGRWGAGRTIIFHEGRC
jgi:hypothetical protein